MNNSLYVSFVVPTRNEESIVERNIQEINRHIKKIRFIKSFEIIISDYSEDSTPKIVEQLSKNNKEIRLVEAPRKGIGIGLKCGINAAANDIIMIYPIDMAWDIKVIPDSVQLIVEDISDFVLGSRGHKDSIVTRPVIRRFFSVMYNNLIKIMFGIKISDTQGTLCFNKAKAKKFLGKIVADDAFFQTEILIYARMHNLRLLEIPVIVHDMRTTTSNINPITEGICMFKTLLALRSQINTKRRTKNDNPTIKAGIYR